MWSVDLARGHPETLRHRVLSNSVQISAAAPRTAVFPSGRLDGSSFTLFLKRFITCSSIERFVGKAKRVIDRRGLSG